MRKFTGNTEDITRRNFAATLARRCLGVSIAPALASMGNPAWAAAASSGKADRVIYLYMSGGMSHLDTLDPKPRTEVQGPTKAIKTALPGVMLSEHMPGLAKLLSKVSLIRSMTSEQGAHAPGRYLAHTSYSPRATIRHPAMGAWMLHELGQKNKNIPGNVVIAGGSNHPGAGYMDLKHGPLPIGDVASGIPNSERLRGVTEVQFNKRLSMVSKFGKRFYDLYPNKKVKGYGEMYADAIRLMRSEDLKAFDIGLEKEATREKYGKDKFGQGCLLARRLIERDVRFVEVGYGGWDTHNENFDRMPEKVPVLDKALSALLQDLQSRGLLKNTLVVLTSEFGRSPKINERIGRDHHPAAFTSILAGAGIKQGYVHGESDKRGHGVEKDPVRVQDFTATIATAVGIDTDKEVFSATRRPFKVADDGEAVTNVLT